MERVMVWLMSEWGGNGRVAAAQLRASRPMLEIARCHSGTPCCAFPIIDCPELWSVRASQR